MRLPNVGGHINQQLPNFWTISSKNLSTNILQIKIKLYFARPELKNL